MDRSSTACPPAALSDRSLQRSSPPARRRLARGCSATHCPPRRLLDRLFLPLGMRAGPLTRPLAGSLTTLGVRPIARFLRSSTPCPRGRSPDRSLSLVSLLRAVPHGGSLNSPGVSRTARFLRSSTPCPTARSADCSAHTSSASPASPSTCLPECLSDPSTARASDRSYLPRLAERAPDRCCPTRIPTRTRADERMWRLRARGGEFPSSCSLGGQLWWRIPTCWNGKRMLMNAAGIAVLRDFLQSNEDNSDIADTRAGYRTWGLDCAKAACPQRLRVARFHHCCHHHHLHFWDG